MAGNQDYVAMMKDMMGKLPVDTSAMDNLFRSQSALAEKMSAVAIEAAQKSTDLSARWAQDTLSKLSTMTQAKAEPADYAKSVTDFLAASAEAAAEHMAAFAEIAKRVQTGKDMSEDVTAAARKAGADLSAAAQKATSVSTNV